MTSGRFWVRDAASGRVFCVEPIQERDERPNERVFTNGGVSGDAVKAKSQVQGGAVPQDESIITEANGFVNIREIGRGVSPLAVIDDLLKS